MEAEANRRVLRERADAMKKHHATRLHYGLRLEWNGVLLSWALPEEPGCCAGEIRKAIEMEDHRSANLLFEGVHETGPIMLWDRGTWEPQLGFDDIESSLRMGILRFTLRGEKLNGGWTLARMNNARNAPRPIWTFCKQADSFAGSRADKASWRSGRTASAQKEVWMRSFEIGQDAAINSSGKRDSSTRYRS